MKLFILLFASVTANADYVYDYSYPISHTLKSTIATAKIVAPESAPNETVKVRIFDRKKNRERRDLKLRLYPSNGHKLVFILAGFGGDADAPLAKFLAAHIQASGTSAVIIPNSMTADFVLGASSSGIVGDVPSDARDMYNVLHAAVSQLRADGRTETEYAVLGFSLGALLAARIQEMDTEENRIGLQSALLINPPVSLLSGLRTLDSYYAQFKSMGLGSKMNLASKIKKFLELIGLAPKEAQAMELSERDLQAAIGYKMRDGFSDMIIATQNILDLEILPETQEDRESSAKKIGFEKYVNEFLIPALRERGRRQSLQSLNGESSLTSQAQFLSNSRNVYVLHNWNDFLVTTSELEWIEATFGHRARIYPRGGHMGNLNHEDNLKAIGNWIHNRPIN